MTSKPSGTPCPRCGASIAGVAVRCGRCGYELDDAPAETVAPVGGGSQPTPPSARTPYGATQEWGTPARTDDPARTSPPMDIVDKKYRLLQRLGEGGFGEVWRAEHVLLKKSCAVKLLNQERSEDPRFRETYIREGRVLVQLEHPNIVQATDLGVAEDGRLYMVMELAQGMTLRQLIERERRLTMEQALRLTDEILIGLEHAHARGIVHRDLKPENVVVNGWGTPDLHVKVLDFGIAKIVAKGVEEGTLRTMRGWGTPPSASPEQMAGLEVDARADVFAVGVMVYEMISGLKFGDLVTRLAKEPPESLAKIAPGTSSLLDKVVRKAISKDPVRRTESVTELRADLKRARDAGPGSSSVAAWVGGCGCLVAMVGAALLIWATWTQKYALYTGSQPFQSGDVDRHPDAFDFPPGAEVLLTARAREGWKFTRWSDGGEANPRRITMPSAEWTVSALFEAAGFDIVATAEPAMAGDVDGGSGQAAAGTSVTLTARTHRGWRFQSWSDGVTANPRTFVMPERSVSVQAKYIPCTVTVVAVVEPEGGGVVSGISTVAHGESLTLTAVPAAEFSFARWGDGVTENPRTWTTGACHGLGGLLCLESVKAEFAREVPEDQVETPVEEEFTLLVNDPASNRIEYRHNKTGVVLVGLFHGDFVMGSPLTDPGRHDDEVPHAVSLRRKFYVGKTEVTNAQFRRFRPDHHAPQDDEDNLPVTFVSWDDAQAYCVWSGLRLLSEAEWEYVARCGDGRAYAWGNAWPPPTGAGNLADETAKLVLDGRGISGYRDGFFRLAPAGSFPESPFGLHDLAGNVWEWVADWYGPYEVGAVQVPGFKQAPVVEPTGPESGTLRVLRGGSWSDDGASDLGAACRGKAEPEKAMNNVGFRVAAWAENKEEAEQK